MYHAKVLADLPDEFYELTKEELKHFYAAQVRSNKTEAPLMSKSFQEREQRSRVLKQHPFTRIRFRFPDRTFIERNFRTTDSVEIMQLALRQALNNAPPFMLSIGPPFRQLKATETIYDLTLYPSAVVNVLWMGVDKQTSIVTTNYIPVTPAQPGDHEPAAKRPLSPTVYK
jgi:hypothetical protein